MQDAERRLSELQEELATGEADLARATRVILELVGADRVSISAIADEADSFEIVEIQGEALLGRGTRFPLETSTHHARAACGSVFVAQDFDGHRGFSRPVDRIVRAHGFRSGASLPIQHDETPCGALNLHWNRIGANAAQACDLLEPLLGPLALELTRPEQTTPTTVLVCHGDPLLGRGIARLLEESGPVRAELVPTYRQMLEVGRLRAPDVVVADESLDERSVDRWAAELRAAGIEAPLLVVAGRDSHESLAAALAAGAAGYVPREDAEASLALAVEVVARGSTWLPPIAEPHVDERLTPRELEVLAELDRGLRFRQVAETLGVSVTTVKTHARSLFRKLGATSRAEATYEARRRGLLR